MLFTNPQWYFTWIERLPSQWGVLRGGNNGGCPWTSAVWEGHLKVDRVSPRKWLARESHLPVRVLCSAFHPCQMYALILDAFQAQLSLSSSWLRRWKPVVSAPLISPVANAIRTKKIVLTDLYLLHAAGEHCCTTPNCTVMLVCSVSAVEGCFLDFLVFWNTQHHLSMISRTTRGCANVHRQCHQDSGFQVYWKISTQPASISFKLYIYIYIYI